MNEILKKYLKAIGVDTKVIDKLEKLTEEEQKTFEVTEIVTEFKDKQKSLYENDAELIDKFKKSESGKILEQVDRRLKQTFGLTKEEIEGKTIEEKYQAAKAKLEEQYKKTDNALQEENINLTKKIKEIEEIEIPKIKGEVENSIKNYKIENALSKKIASKELRTKPEFALMAVKGKLGEKYIFDINENNELDVLTKEGKLKVKNADGTGILSADELITGVLVEGDFLKQSNADETPKTPVVIPAATKDVPTESEKKAAEHLKFLKENTKK